MKLKTLALAAMTAVAAPSFAAVVTNSGTYDPSLFGTAEYVFVATNDAGSYFQDLGVSANGIMGLAAGTSFTQSVAGSEWNKFVAFGGTNTKWAIIAAEDIADGFTPGEKNAWTTRNVNQPLGTIQNSQSNDGTSNLAITFLTNDAVAVNAGMGQDNNRLAQAFGTVGYIDGRVLAFNTFFDAKNDIGVQSEMVYLTSASEVSDAPSLYEVMSTTANFDGTTISITAAVPEPSTYAMLFAGLAAVGFMARRRKV